MRPLIGLSAIFAQPESELWHERIDRELPAIIAAIRDCDPKRASRDMTAHLQGIRATLGALR